MDDPDRSTRLVEHVERLAGVKRKGSAAQLAWYVDNRLVARVESADRWIISLRLCPEGVAADPAHPETFGVRPRYEAHEKVEAYPQDGDLDAIVSALDAAWEMQRTPMTNEPPT